MKNRSRSTLFLMEQIIVILVFAICAAACVKTFVDSHLTAAYSRDTRNSIIIAENAAECFKAKEGDLVETALFLGASQPDGSGEFIIYFDGDCRAVDKASAQYSLKLTETASEDSANLHIGELTVSRLDGEELFSLSVAAYGGGTG